MQLDALAFSISLINLAQFLLLGHILLFILLFNCHHQITYCKLNLKIDYPPPQQRLAWNFEKAYITSIRKVIFTVNWQFLFFNGSVHEQIYTFSNTLMNIFSNYIPDRLVTIDGKDPPWMTEKIKNKILGKNYIYKSYACNGKTA